MTNDIKPIDPSKSNITTEASKVTAKQFVRANELVYPDLYKKEQFRQASWSFNLVFGTMASAAITILLSVPLYLTGNVPAAKAATTAGGLLCGVITCTRKLYKDTNDRAERLNDIPSYDAEKESLDGDKDKLNPITPSSLDHTS